MTDLAPTLAAANRLIHGDYHATLDGRQQREIDVQLVAGDYILLADQVAELKATCPLCGHEWSRHDPEDGCCDAHSSERFSVCECGRDMAWMHRKTAALSTDALEGEKA